jgi:putative nucleotidyltransferase with HDIG domain
LIEQDPLISAKIIGLANAPMLGLSRKVSSVGDAAMLLGLTRVKSVAIGIAAMSSLTKKSSGVLNTSELWIHSMAIAVAMRTIAQEMPTRNRPLDDQIFFAGLLHYIGYMALDYIDTPASDALHTALQQPSYLTLEQIEKNMVGITHAELGAQLARHWDLPEEIISVIRYHHNPEENQAHDPQPLVYLVNIAEKLLGEFGLPQTEPLITKEEWLELSIDYAKADDIRNQVDEVASQAGQMAAFV